jgi:AcrR family transcriptional regulator
VILDAAVSLARKRGLRSFSRDDVASEAQVASATVSYHYGKMQDLLRAVVENAINNEILPILADARTDRNSPDLFLRMSAELKQKVAAHITR